MANELRVWDIGVLKAAADLSTKQHLFMKLSAAMTVNVCGAGEAMVGVLQNKPAAAGRACEIRRLGLTKIILGGTVAANAKVKSDANGKAVTATAGSLYGGVILEGGDANDIVTMIMEIGSVPA